MAEIRTDTVVAAALAAGWLLVSAATAQEAPGIRLNTIGYLPDARKTASIAGECLKFTVVRVKDGTKALDGPTGEPRRNRDTGEELCEADFSALREPGEYRLEVPGVGRSAPFRVASDVYNGPFRTVTRGMYLWRCGTAVRGTHGGETFAHGPCHTADAYLDYVGGGHERKDGTKGWHDAGDYNKYVVNAGVTVGCMFRAWEDFGPQVRKVRLDIPESGGRTPDFLAEIRWELEWLLTMQAPDGSVYHKLSTTDFGGFLLPELERADRYFTPWSSAATAGFVAMTAAAARHFKPFDPAFSDRCLAAARKSSAFLKAHPEDHRGDLRGFRTGGYQTGDPDDRLWAAAEVWETTGDAEALRDVQARIGSARGRFDADWDWGNVKNLGLLTWLLSKRQGRDEALVQRVREDLLSTANGIVAAAKAHGYARPLGTRYYWGCNGSVARQTLVLQAACRLSGKPEYRQTALDALNHLFGRNCYGRSFVTGLGFRPPMRPHDRRSGGDKVDDPWPGYLIGGPHPRATDWRDVQGDYRTNEIALNWNGALLYALAAFLDTPGP